MRRRDTKWKGLWFDQVGKIWKHVWETEKMLSLPAGCSNGMAMGFLACYSGPPECIHLPYGQLNFLRPTVTLPSIFNILPCLEGVTVYLILLQLTGC